MKDAVKQEFLPSKEEPDKIEFDLKDDESDSIKEQEGYWKGILHMISIQIFLCLLLIMILELLRR